MKTKIWYGNQYVESFNCDGKKYTKKQIMKFKIERFFKKWLSRTAITLAIVWIGVIGLKIGQHYFPETVYAEKTVEVQVQPETTIPPVMKRIAKCESGDMQLGKDGQVIYKSNTNGTVDVGRYQINSIWFKEATKLGLDLTKEKDNEAMAMWIYHNYGTGDWSASAKCWK